MENSNQYDELLVRYLANDVTIEERESTEKWIAASEQNRAYFTALKKAWELSGVWDTFRQVNIDDRWNHFKQAVSLQQAPKVQPVISIKWLRRIAIAACLLGAVALVWVLFVKKEPPPAIVENTIKKDSVINLVHREVNTTGKERTVHLPDGSLIILASHSEVTYKEPFPQKRQLALTGKAWFKVTKDSLHSFTVGSGELTTTALGTEFSVTAFAGTDSITVRLYEGKVVVKAVNESVSNMKKAVYLLPGQEFVYDGENGKVGRFQLKQTAPEQLEEGSPDNPRIVYDEKENWYIFNNQSLESVLQNLSALYNVKIIYNKKDIQHIDFTGKYDKADSLETILKRIGILNNLKITRRDTAFVISK